jgi:hypothetical protein
MPPRVRSSDTRKNNVTVVARVTPRAIRLMANPPRVEWRLALRVYLEIVVVIIGLLGAFVALAYLAA